MTVFSAPYWAPGLREKRGRPGGGLLVPRHAGKERDAGRGPLGSPACGEHGARGRWRRCHRESERGTARFVRGAVGGAVAESRSLGQPGSSVGHRARNAGRRFTGRSPLQIGRRSPLQMGWRSPSAPRSKWGGVQSSKQGCVRRALTAPNKAAFTAPNKAAFTAPNKAALAGRSTLQIGRRSPGAHRSKWDGVRRSK